LQAAESAGLSKDQAVTAIRVANVPDDEFELAIESDDPPTVTELAKRGTKPQRKSDAHLMSAHVARARVSASSCGIGARPPVDALTSFHRPVAFTTIGG
jgi:hypothetical protein